MVSKNVKIIIGSILAIIGVVTLLQGMGIINILSTTGTYFMSTIGGKTAGIEITSTKIEGPIALSTVGEGYEYKWRVTVRNRGTINWNDFWTIHRLGVRGATVTDCTVPRVGGSWKCEQCQYGKDTQACRIDIRTWGFAYSLDDGNTWNSCPEPREKNCHLNSIVLTGSRGMASGGSVTYLIKLKIPSVETGDYPLITDGRVWLEDPLPDGTTYAISGNYDMLTVGTIVPEISFTLLGLLSIIGAVGMFVWALV